MMGTIMWPQTLGEVGNAAAANEALEVAVAEASPISDERLQSLLAYWRQKAGHRPMPRRADIDPGEIPKLLPDVMLVEVLPSGRYRYRLIGTGNTAAQGINATGRYLDEVLPGPEYRDHVIGLYNECVQMRRPVYSESLFISPQRIAERHTKVIFLPLAKDGETVDMVLVMQIFRYIDQNTRNRHFLEVRPYKEIAHAVL
jgi:hypothetical protein